MTCIARRGLLHGILLLAACARAPVRDPGPSNAIGAYGDALAAGDLDRAYDLMASAYRARVTREAFAAQVRAGGAAHLAATGRLRDGTVEPRARLAETGVDPLCAVLEDGEWRLCDDPTEVYGQRTPEQTIRSFIRALERRRWDRAAQLLCSRARREATPTALAAEAAALAGALRRHLGDQLLWEGEAAVRLPHGERAELRLIREEGLWCVEDPD